MAKTNNPPTPTFDEKWPILLGPLPKGITPGGRTGPIVNMK
jgi:hypothetical protein